MKRTQSAAPITRQMCCYPAPRPLTLATPVDIHPHPLRWSMLTVVAHATSARIVGSPSLNRLCGCYCRFCSVLNGKASVSSAGGRPGHPKTRTV